MRRLSGMDSAFIYGETPTWHMHVCSVIIADPSDLEDGFDVDRLKQQLVERLPQLPQFRWKLVEVPLHLDRPGWVEDADFDIDYHVRRIAVPSPGSPKELNRLVGDLASYQLDRSRPLWELWVIEGVENGMIAIFAKIHHAIIDGASGAGLSEILLDLEPDPPPRDITERENLGSEPPHPLDLVARGLLRFAVTPWRFGQLAGQMIRQGVEVARVASNPDRIVPPMGIGTPRTPLNGEIGPHRSFATASVSLDDVKAIKNAFDVKLNDVVLALAGSSIRRWLIDENELPDDPLIAQVPVSLRTDGDDEVGNKVGNMFTSLATDIDDPGERLLAIHAATQSAKEMREALAVHRIMGLSEAAPPRLISLASRMYSLAQLDRNAPPPMNVVISNVPGPPFELYMAGAKLKGMYPLGPLLMGNRLEITVISFTGRLDFGFMADRDNAPDPQVFADYIPEAMRKLEKAAAKRQSAEKKAAEKAAKKKPTKKKPTKKKPAKKATSSKNKSSKKPAKKGSTKKSATKPDQA